MKLRVEGHTNLMKDTSNGAVINTDSKVYRDHIAAKRQRENESKKIELLEAKMSRIEQLLERLVNDNN